MSDRAQPSAESALNESPTPAVPPPPTLALYESDALFQGARVVNITHAGETYRLLITRNNRLILQK
ncbi:MAG: hemin uptake protein HemP [Pirellulales bacterium]|nr:hemin uptake protein HemP [Pirellulales bacterium]